MPQVTPSTLDRVCGNPNPNLLTLMDAVQSLGALAPWWLSHQAREQLRIHQPELVELWDNLRPPSSLGSCSVLLANINQDQFPLLADAFVLPLCWEQGSSHSPRLPPLLCELADLVLSQLSELERIKGKVWGLRLAKTLEQDDIDLRELDRTVAGWESAWCSLVAGLVLLSEGIVPRSDILASLAHDPKLGIAKVAGVSAKLELACRCGAEQLYLPGENQREALEWKNDNKRDLKIGFVNPSLECPEPQVTLRDFLGTLGVPPDASAPFERRKVYYARQTRSQADQYHWDCLLDEISHQCRRQLQEDCPNFTPTHLVTVVSNAPSAVVLGVAASGATYCLLLYEDKQKRILESRDQIQERLRNLDIEVSPAPITLTNREDDYNAIQYHVNRFLEGVSPKQTTFDLTPGYKSISLALDEMASQGSWLIYCRHQQLPPDNRVDPGSERFDCWQKL